MLFFLHFFLGCLCAHAMADKCYQHRTRGTSTRARPSQKQQDPSTRVEEKKKKKKKFSSHRLQQDRIWYGMVRESVACGPYFVGVLFSYDIIFGKRVPYIKTFVFVIYTYNSIIPKGYHTAVSFASNHQSQVGWFFLRIFSSTFFFFLHAAFFLPRVHVVLCCIY